MKLIFQHFYWMLLEHLRSPSYIVSTIAFPALFYVVFAIPESKDAASSNMLLASFSCFSVFGVVFLQFGVGISQEKTKSWYSYLKTLPIQWHNILLARFLLALFFSLLAAGGIISLALSFTHVNLTLYDWILFVVILLAAGFSFCFMGLALGYWATEKSSLPMGNLIYLPLSFAGGLWKPPSILPENVKAVSELLPTRHYGEILWAFVKGASIDEKHVFFLLGYGLLFSLFAFWGFKRNERIRMG